MVEVSQQTLAMMNGEGQSQAIGSNIYSSRSTVALEPEPNPPFVFPMLPLQSTLSTLSEPSTDDHAAPKRPTSRSRPQRLSMSPLPPLGFPSPTTPPAAEPCEHSPSRCIPSSRTGGHKRGGSEFIGGDGSTAGPGLMSSSPTKGVGALPSPPMSGRRRGHAHRRSGAISNHDLSTILKPSIETNALRSGSAPTTPSDPNANRQFMPGLDRSASQPSLTYPKTIEPTPLDSPRESSPATVQSRPRVGFSDMLEYIPRPLSTISSATSSSMSTVRASHSLTGSITSIRSLSTSSPPLAGKHDSSKAFVGEDLRPRTADYAEGGLSFDSPFRPVHRLLSSPNISTSPISGRTTRIGLQHSEDSNFTKAVREPSQREPKNQTPTSTQTNFQPPQFQANLLRLRGTQDSANISLARPRSSPEAKISKRQRKGGSWAGLLSRKAKHRVSADHAALPGNLPITSQHSNPMDEFSLDDITFDEDTTYVIRSPDYEIPRSAPASDISIWKDDMLPENEPSSVLDLDATWEALDIGSQSGSGRFGSLKRQMRSGNSAGPIVGTGVNYHRRAESAPVMAPVDYQFGLHRLGSNSQMADVFEEEEDEDGSIATSTSKTSPASTRDLANADRATGVDMKIGEVESKPGTPVAPVSKHKSSNPVTKEAEIVDMGLASSQCPHEEYLASVIGDVPVEIVDAVEEPRFSVVTKSSDESTITPTLSNDALRIQLPGPLELVEPEQRQFFPLAEVSSLNPSPDFAQTSFDVPRLNTARSSITDRSAWGSARTRESGPDMSYSTEDVPSLTSSASTMISHVPFSPTVGERPEGERSLSLSAAVPRRNRPVSAGKRSSLASLSRLVGSSYGEKSKLSIESRAQPEEGEKSDKKKRHRISRLMKFWKSKENLKT